VAAIRILVDTDILIDYFNTGQHASVLDDRKVAIYYSVVTKKELLAKDALKDSERLAILEVLRKFRLVPVTPAIARDSAAVLYMLAAKRPRACFESATFK
jgi:predicted nucleic acid-binding protein